MITLKSYILNEGEIGNLKNVCFIRHYTTLGGLLSILKDGKIKANESEGDWDWDEYDIGPDKVVSFHDSRYDPEITEILWANDHRTRLAGTQTLGLHSGEICAFIEYQFDILPQKIKEQATHIKMIEHFVDEFVELWNEFAVEYKGCKDLTEYYSLEDIPGHYSKKECESAIELLNRKNLKEFYSSDTKALLNAAINDDKKTVLKILKEHGWKSGDEENPVWWTLVKSTRYNFLMYVANRFLGESDYMIQNEIRIACDMPINLKGCTIHFFEGMADDITRRNPKLQKTYDKVMEELSRRNNVEIYKPGDDYSLIEN